MTVITLPAESGALEVFSEIETRCLALEPRPKTESQGAVPDDENTRIKAWLDKKKTAFAAKAAGEDLEIAILGVIGGGFWSDGVSARSVRNVLEQHKNVKTIRVLIDSPGGDYFDGVAIMNMLKRHAANVTIEVIGEATSAGSVIAMGGDRIEMHVGTMMMIHQAWTFAMGNADELRNSADMLGKVDASLIALYTARTGKPKDEIETLVRATTWMTAAEAVKDGFADAEIAAKKTGGDGKSKASREFNVRDLREAHARALSLGAAPPAVDSSREDEPPAPAPQPEPQPEPTPAAKAPEPNSNPSPGGPEPQQTPIPGEENHMTDQNKHATPAVASAMGLPAGSTEQDMIACAARQRGLELEIMTLTGSDTSAAALGAVRGLKAKADGYDKMAAELSTVKAERDKQNFEALVMKGTSKPVKLSPATKKLYEDRFDAAVKDGRGSEIVNDLRGFLDVAPTIHEERTINLREPKINSSGSLTWNGKTFGELTYAQKARLANEDKDLYQAMRRDHQESSQSA